MITQSWPKCGSFPLVLVQLWPKLNDFASALEGKGEKIPRFLALPLWIILRSRLQTRFFSDIDLSAARQQGWYSSSGRLNLEEVAFVRPDLTAMLGYYFTNRFRQGAFACILMGVLCFFFANVEAGHIAGVDLSYECINGCTIRVHFKAYRDCSSPITNVSPIGTLSIVADSGCPIPPRIAPWINASNQEVTPVCPGTPTRCNTPNAAINGIMEHYWYADYDFCAATCSTYTIQWQTCCRNGNITTLFLPNSIGLFASTTVNPFLSPCNSAPTFNTPPVLFICQNQNYFFSQGATDPDGDSLSYALGPCSSGPGTAVPYLSFSSPTHPLGPDWELILDSLTGDLIIRPDPNGPFPGSLQTGVLCIYVQEWRAGQLINTIVRDLQITVIPCASNDPPVTFGVVNLFGGIQINQFSVSTCLGATMCFDLRITDSDLLQTHTVWWNQSLAPLGATFTLAANPSVTDTIVGLMPTVRFCWTPPTAGNFNFGVIMRDDACPTYGISQYNFQIEVTEISLQSQDSVTGCKVVELCALPQGGHFPYHYLWSGVGGLSNNPGNVDSCLAHSYPSSGAFPFTLTLQDAIGCTAVWQDTVVIPNNVLADAGPDMTQCANQPTIIGNPPQPSQLLTYAWSPPIGLSNANSAQPTVTLSNNTALPHQQAYILAITDTITFCVDEDTMVMTVYPIPSSPFNMPDTICQYELIGIPYLGSSGLNATYDWTFAGGIPNIASGQGPHQVSWSSPGLHEVALTVTENGCPSPTERDTIFVRTNPTALIGPVNDQCLVGNSFNFQQLGNFGLGATHAWTFWPNASPSTSFIQNPTGIVFSTAGPKIASVRTTDGTCSSLIDSLLFEVFPDPDALWAVLGGVQCFNGNSHQFVANAGNGPLATYAWTFQDGNPATSADTLPIVSFLSPGPKVVTLTVTANGCTFSHTDTVDVYPEPVVVAGPDMSFCQGDGGVGIAANVTGGTQPFYYSWSCNLGGFCGIDSVFDDDPHVNPANSGTYLIQVTDANGCTSNVDSLRVTVLSKPTVDAGPDLYLCGLNAPCQVLLPNVIGQGPFSFEWFPALGLNDSSLFNPCARPDSTTIYVLIATDLSTGCSSDYNTLDTMSSVVVNVNPVPIANAGPDVSLCPGDTAILQGIGSGAGPAYQYQWTPANSLQLANVPSPHAFPSMTTIYSLSVWSNGCPGAADTVRVNVHTTPSVDAGWNQDICLGESILLDANAAGDSTAQYTYQWSTAVGLNNPNLEDPIATPPRSTTYFVVATSNWGCSSAADSVTITLRPTPLANAGRDTVLCFGHGLNLNGSYFYGETDSVADPSQIQYAWTPTVLLSDSSISQPYLLPQNSGMYYLNVTHQDCQTVDSVLVLVIPALNAGIAADTTVICRGDSLQLHASGGLGNPSYQWGPVSGFDDATNAQPWAYFTDSTQVQLILSEAGCSDTVFLELAVIPSPVASFLHSEESGCAPLEVSVLENSSDAQSFLWNFGDGSPVSNLPATTHIYSFPGTYSLEFTALHQGACASEATTLMVTVFPSSSAEAVSTPDFPAILWLPEAFVTLESIASQTLHCNWDFGDGIQANGHAVSHRYQEPGIYWIVVHAENAHGCWEHDSLGPYVVRIPELFVPNVFSPNADGIGDVFQVNYAGDQPFVVSVLDRWGSEVFRSNEKNADWDGMVRGQAAPEGVYYYQLKIGNKDFVGELTLVR